MPPWRVTFRVMPSEWRRCMIRGWSFIVMAIVMMKFCREPLRSLVILGDILTRAVFYRFYVVLWKEGCVMWFLMFRSSGESVFSISCGPEEWHHWRRLNGSKVIKFFFFNHYCRSVCGMYLPQCTCSGQRTILSISSLKLRSLGSCLKCFYPVGHLDRHNPILVLCVRF